MEDCRKINQESTQSISTP